jgi:hypothetical protein
MKASKLIPNNLFSFYFSKSLSFVTLGSYEKYLMKGDVAYEDVKGSDEFWRAGAKSAVSLKSGSTTKTATHKYDFVFDSTI